jgi:7-keto-8-aminopelargonate synthetase-like enzyme
MAKSTNKFINTIDECLSNGVKSGIFQVSTEDESLNGREVTIEGRRVVNFGSCSYLGLEMDDRLKQGAIDATLRYGTQYSSSRAYSFCNLYEELEHLFYKIFDNNPAVMAATTTLAHVAAVPILVQSDDLVILDHQVHGSVQLAAQLVKAQGAKVEMIKHNRMDMLETMIKENPNKYNKIWYMADGLYSMYGDYAPMDDIVYLMEKYHNFHLYIDDAHGMSWKGRNGNGYVLSEIPLHPKMVLTTSLAKGFGTGGGVTVMSDKEMMRKILTCGSSYTFSGPVQPPMLGASVASARLHLTNEIYTLQETLRNKIKLTKKIIEQYDLPLVHPSDSPIFYLALGLPRTGYNMVKRLLNEGYFTNIGIFPGVPVNCTGLRLPITNGHTDEDIKGLLDAFKYHFPKVLEEEGVTVDKISTSFKMPFLETKKHFGFALPVEDMNELAIQHETTIHKVEKVLWNELLGESNYDWEGCRFMEETFSNKDEIENNWQLHYLIIRDKNKKPVLVTLFTELICKDDMIAPASVSQQVEEIRKKEKYYLTSKVIMMGTLITEGTHIYIDKSHPAWKKALLEMIRVMNEAKEKSGASMIQLRDLYTADLELSDFLIKEGFIKVEMPETHILSGVNKWKGEEEFIKGLSGGNRWHIRRKVLDKKDFFNVNVLTSEQKIEPGKVDDWYRLYSNVKGKSLNINTYELPRKYFENLASHPSWEVIELTLKSNDSDRKEEPVVAVGFCYKSLKNNYAIVLVGLDYNYVVSHGCYRQILYQSILRANELNCENHYMGMDAAIEKQRFGTDVISKSVYIQADDNFNLELISTVYTKK